MTTTSEEHDHAVQRLDAAVAEQDRLTGRHEAALGTQAELSADVHLHAAEAEVMAREAWLKWVDDDGYRGLNAGPFDLRRELEDSLGPVR
jgi:hypothetical protein